MITLHNFSKSYGNKQIFSNVTISFSQPSSIYCLQGASGSGKTTLFNVIFGIDKEYEGEYLYHNQDTKSFSKERWDQIRKKDLRVVYQDQKLLDFLSVRNNLKFAVDYELEESVIDETLELLNLQQLQHSIVKDISDQEKRRVAIGSALISQPQILLLDEPTKNLDDDNCRIILNCLQKIKQDRLLILISLDERVKEIVDFVYQVSNQTITKFDYFDQAIQSEYHPVKIKVSRHKLLSYTREAMKMKWIKLVPVMVSIILVFSVFTIGINHFQQRTFAQVNPFSRDLSNQTIVLNTHFFTQEYINEVTAQDIFPRDDGRRIFFSEDDLEAVKALPMVKEAKLLNSTAVIQVDKDGYSLNETLAIADLPESVSINPLASYQHDHLYLSFLSMPAPSEYMIFFSTNQISLIEGDYPEEGSNEILIPSYVTEKFFNKGVDSSLINRKLKLSVQLNGEVSTKTYKVSGVYEPNEIMIMNGTLDFYVPYQEDGLLDTWLTEETYQYLSESMPYESSTEYTYVNPLFDNYDRYVEAIGTGLGNMVVVADSVEDVESLSTQLKELFPNLTQRTRHSMVHVEYTETYDYIFRLNVISATVGIVLVSLVCLSINGYVLKKRQGEMSVLYSQGYSTKSLKFIFLSEYLITSLLNIVVTFIVLFISYQLYFKHTDLNAALIRAFEPQQILLVALLLLLTTFTTVLLILREINPKNLLKQLKK